MSNIFTWFKLHELVVDSGKSCLLISPCDKISDKILDTDVKFSPCDELLGNTIGCESTFLKDIMPLCSKANHYFIHYSSIQ